MEGVLFKVDKRLFEKCQTFMEIYNLPTGGDESGSNDQSPFILEGVGLEDFRAFLKVLTPQCARKTCLNRANV